MKFLINCTLPILLISIFTYSQSTNQFRSKSSLQITHESQNKSLKGVSFENNPPGFHAVPRITKDDDGFSKENVKTVDRSSWTSAKCGNKPCVCGLTQKTVEARIADCKKHEVIGPEATWFGEKNGNSGQGTWKLVSRSSEPSGEGIGMKGREVWQDQRTKLLWSSRVSLGVTWCMASGNNNIKNNPTSEDDPADTCDNKVYQNVGTGPADKAISACYEDGENFFTQKYTAIDPEGKVGLGANSTPRVAWRLPTMDDYLVANINGIRFVMPDMLQNGNWEWTSMVLSANRGSGWDYSTDFGGVGNDNRRGLNGARCVGR